MVAAGVIARRARSARRGNRVVGHRASGIAIWPGAAKAGLRSGWRNADYADLHADGRRLLRSAEGVGRAGWFPEWLLTACTTDSARLRGLRSSGAPPDVFPGVKPGMPRDGH